MAETAPEPQTPDLTFGQQAVGINFNPAQDIVVADVKQRFADLIDICNVGREHAHNAGDQQKARHFAVAITDLETAQMRVVKALTWGKK